MVGLSLIDNLLSNVIPSLRYPFLCNLSASRIPTKKKISLSEPNFALPNSTPSHFPKLQTDHGCIILSGSIQLVALIETSFSHPIEVQKAHSIF
jgi:hypothetical protein